MKPIVDLPLADLLPGRLAPYVPLVEEGLHFFLDRLPDHRRREIEAEKAIFPPETHPAVRVVALMRACPTLHKLGQVVAREQRLPLEFRRNLQHLEVLAPHSSSRELSGVVEQELGDIGSKGIALCDSPLAEGSVAVIWPFVWRDRDGHEVDGVFKILKPGIEERVEEELAVWRETTLFMDEASARLGLPSFEFRRVLDEVGDLLRSEISPLSEQDNLAAAARVYADEPRVVIPALLPFCTLKLTAMERLFGEKLTNVDAIGEGGTRQLGEWLVETLLGVPFWNHQSTSLLHADPHAGNLMLVRSSEGSFSNTRIGLVDWSLSITLTKSDRIQLAQFVLATFLRDRNGILNAWNALGIESSRFGALTESADRVLQLLTHEYHGFPGFRWLTNAMDSVVREYGVRFPAWMMILRKSLLTLEGVIRDVHADADFDAVLFGRLIQTLMSEWPARAAFPVNSRHFASHLSTWDFFTMIPRLAWSNATTMADLWAKWSKYAACEISHTQS